MRILRAELQAFGPFRERQVAHFDAFREDGLFLIGGRTGAGKSSVLDAIVFALYDVPPRYEGETSRGVRSDFAELDEPTFVDLEFEHGGRTYRVRREPEWERPKKRGTGFTKKPAKAELFERDGGQWRQTAAGPRDVGQALSEILPLTRDQFLQVMLLAQNRFQAFLNADHSDRQKLLRSLFNTREFQRIEEAAKRIASERSTEAELSAKTLESAVTVLHEQLDALANRVAEVPVEHAEAAAGADTDTPAQMLPAEETPTLPGIVTSDAEPGGSEKAPADEAKSDSALSASSQRPDAVIPHARTRIDQARQSMALLESVLEEARSVAERLEIQAREAVSAAQARQKIAAAEAQAAVLANDDSEIERVAGELRDARHAAPLAPIVDAVTLADQRHATAQDARAAAFARVRDLPIGPGDEFAPIDDDGLRARLRDVVKRLDRIEDAARALREHDDRVREQATLDEERDAIAQRISDVSAELDKTPVARDAIVTERASLAAVAGELAERRDGQRRSELRLRAAELSDELASAHRETASTEQERRAALERAEADLRSRLIERADAAASMLALELHPGSACPVCGATEHPDPADPVDASEFGDRAITLLQDEVATRKRLLDDAHEATAAVAARLADAQRDAEGRSTAVARRELEAAVALTSASEAATEAVARLDDDLASLETRTTKQSDAKAALQHRLDEVTARSAVLSGEIAQLHARIGEHTATGIDGERRQAEREHDALQHAIECAQTASEAQDEHERAVARLAEALAGSVFDSADEVRRATRDDAQISEMDARIRAHEAKRTRLRAILDDATLREQGASSSEDPALAEEQRQRARQRELHLNSAHANLANAIEATENVTDRTASAVEAESAHVERARIAQTLAQTLAGRGQNIRQISLESFVLAEELRAIVDAANARLSDMTNSRYLLEYDGGPRRRNAASGLSLSIFDAHTGRSRSTDSLSGGETFLASLALALGLSDVVSHRAGGVQLDTLFIDEGFGSLDAQTLNVAMATLDGLRRGGRTVGVISHVTAMQEQIPSQMQIHVSPRGDSVIEQP